ncbi:acyl-CoA dehydrogenase family protein [Klebsiella pneumoniae]|nr:acyl-CoA dehydrogenase family protein [Klebsiella pneumoniae]
MIHPERDDWARQLTALRQQMAEQAASLDASGEFPWRNIDHLRAGGWLSLAVPPSCGGAGASLAQLQQVIAAIAWGEPATALIVCMQYLHHLRLAENDAWHAPLRQQVFHDAVEHGGLINSLRVEPELGSPARVPAGLGHPLSRLPRVQEKVGQIAGLLLVNRSLLEQAAALRFSAIEANLAKVTITDNAIQAVNIALELTGNHGLSRQNPLERHYRNVLCGRVHTPQSDSAWLAAGNFVFQSQG